MNEPFSSRTGRFPALFPALALAVFAFFFVVSAAGAEASEERDAAVRLTASFHLEGIAVEGLRHADAELIVAESLLVAGGVYDEDALRGAVDRVRRLPFVRDASFSLRKGSQRGLYVLVVTVEETRRFFFGANLAYNRFEGDLFFTPEDPLDEDSDLAILAGMRLFVGRHGTAFLALRDTELQAGYSRNRVFGRAGWLRMGYRESLGGTCCDARTFGSAVDPGFSSWSRDEVRSLSLGLTLPFDARRGVSAEIEVEESDEGRRFGRFDDPVGFGTSFDVTDYRNAFLSIAWFRDTTDDSVFARRGSRLVASLAHRRLDAELTPRRVSFPPDPAPDPASDPADEVASYSSRTVRLEGLASRFWSPSPRHTLWGTLSLAVSTTDLEGFPLEDEEVIVAGESYESVEIAAELGHRVRLLDGKGAGRELFWETTWLYARDEASTEIVPGSLEHQRLETGLVWRTSWGLFRFGLRVVDVSGPEATARVVAP